jgi:hypothetical protein
MTRTVIGGAWVLALSITLGILLGGCGPAVEDIVVSPPKPGQEEAVRIALAAYELPATTPVPIAWVDGWCLNDHPRAPKGEDRCIGGIRDQDNGQVWIAWREGYAHVRSVAETLAHEILHIKSPGDLHGCPSTEDPVWQEHHRCGPLWGVGELVDQVTQVIARVP